MNRRQAIVSVLTLLVLPASAQEINTPDPDLAAIQGTWHGKLTYRDYSHPDRMVTLPTRLYVALAAPNELTLHYVFDDGPKKTVYSYERMAFDFERKVLIWTSGTANAKTRQNRITSSPSQDGGRSIAFEREGENGTIHRYFMRLSPMALSLSKEEGTPSARFLFRNKYEFTRGETARPS